MYLNEYQNDASSIGERLTLTLDVFKLTYFKVWFFGKND